MISDKVSGIKPSATLAVSAKAKAMKKQGVDVVGFGAGEPDFDTPEHIKEAAKKALDEGFTKYTPAAGIDELRRAVAGKLKKDSNLGYSKDDIVISNGGKHTLCNIMLAMLNDGDEAVLPVPYWVSYAEQIKLAGGNVAFADTENLKIKADLIADKITDRTKLIILNSPSNPSGMMCRKSEMKKIADLAVTSRIHVVSDEVYEKFVYGDEEHASIAAMGDEIKKLTIIANAASKTYSMTGWRIGFSASETEIAKAMSNLQSHTTSNPCSIAQKAALAAYTGPQDCVKKMLAEFAKRRDVIVKGLNDIGLECPAPDGAFYAFPSIKSTGLTSMDFCSQLLEKEKVAAVPGIAFGMDDRIRMSFACSMEDINKGLERIGKFVKSL
jgi:aspartate aminotransferase